MIRVSVTTLGCKTNQAESASIIGALDPAKYTLVDPGEEADLYLINTCTVTNRTDYKSRYYIRKALERKKQDPSVRIVVTGCYSQRSKDEVMSLGDIDLVIDNQAKLDIPSLLEGGEYDFMDIMQAKDFHYVPQQGMGERSRAFQKIQDGCDYYCSYCAVPYARGHIRSARLEDVVSQAKLFVANGYKEIVLGGVNLGLYRDNEHDLTEVIRAFDQIPGLEIVRLSSLEPQLFNARLLDAVQASPKLAPHFHIALQSGSDSVLKRMKRVYGTSVVRELVSRIHAQIPFAAIGFDVIAGFPGETEDEFRETVNFLSELDFCYLHVFSYSKRKGTPAATMPGQIDSQTKQTRANILIDLAEQKRQSYMRLLIEDQVPLRGIVEHSEGGVSTFLSDHFIRAYASTIHPQGELISIIPNTLYADGLI